MNTSRRSFFRALLARTAGAIFLPRLPDHFKWNASKTLYVFHNVGLIYCLENDWNNYESLAARFEEMNT